MSAPLSMSMTFERGGRRWRVAPGAPVDLSIPLDFYGPQPEAFFIPGARAHALEAGRFVGDTRRGGSANCETVTITPHGNGTHTECVGHITRERVAIGTTLREAFVPATFVRVALQALGECGERYDGAHHPDDLVIARAALEAALEGCAPDMLDALVIACLLDDGQAPEGRLFSGTNPPYLTNEAAEYIVALGVRHLLVDVPSLDREEDGGRLSSHHIYWGLYEGAGAPDRDGAATARAGATVTEMIRVPDDLQPGVYLLNLQIPHFVLDAAPSRPLLFALEA